MSNRKESIFKQLTDEEDKRLRHMLNLCDNKYQTFDVKKRFMKEVMSKVWTDDLLPMIRRHKFECVEFHSNSFHISSNREKISFFPHSRRIQVHSTSKWIGPINRFEIKKTIEELLSYNDPELSDQCYMWSEVLRVADEMLDTTHGLTASQKDRIAQYLKSLAEQNIKEKAI